MNGTNEAAQSFAERKSFPTENRLGHFRLVYQLGEGGMGAVYAARDLSSPGVSLVALKTTKQQGIEAERLLQDEARIASQIDHQNVCRVHELGKSDETQYMVLDYCDGASLHDLLQASEGGRLSKPLAVKICAQVAAGLHAAHELRGPMGELLDVIHRDVSPQNVLISSTGLVSVTDFGVAKSKGQAHRPTETGEVKGKASYMAPEQIRSRDVDRRADVFALACVLYQALLGERPFGGESTVSTLYQILEEPIKAPHEHEESFPDDLEKLLMKALEKDRDERFATAEEFQLELESWLVENGHLVTEREVQAGLMDALGAEIEERKVEILRLAHLEPEDMEPVSSPDEKAGDTTPPATAFEERKPRRKKGAQGPIFGLTAAAVLFAGVVVFLERQPEEQVQTSSAPSTLSPVAKEEQVNLAAAEEPELVEVKLKVVPEAAVITVDGDTWGAGEVKRELEASPKVRTVTAELAGYLSVSESIAFSETKTVVLTLTPAPKSAGPKAPPTKNRKPKPAKPQPKAQKRALDADNPFAN